MPIHQVKYRIYSEDTDHMGIVYHANYLRFFERARTDMLRSLGLSLSHLASEQIHFAITQAQIQYHHPARLDDLINITTQFSDLKPVRMTFLQKMENQSGHLLSSATIKVVCLNEQFKPRRLPDVIQAHE